MRELWGQLFLHSLRLRAVSHLLENPREECKQLTKPSGARARACNAPFARETARSLALSIMNYLHVELPKAYRY